jgi:hypothetical protein
MNKDDRYKINVIRCNTNTLSKKGPSKARSVDDMDAIYKEEKDPEPIILSNANMDLKPAFLKKLTMKHLEMIASRTKTLERKMTKTRSRTK